MNDVLKSFTAWNPDTSMLYTVGYTAGIATDHLLQRFPFDLRRNEGGVPAFLKQVKGARLSLDLGNRRISGQLIAIVEQDRAVQPQTLVKDHRLTVLAGGSVQTVWLSDVQSFELEEPDLSSQLSSYLEIMAEGRQDATREVTVYPAATGPATAVNVAYVQHFPVWKTSYRLELSVENSRIQGWTQIDNPTGEAWDNIDVTLVSGMPTSFVMNLYEPLYTSRQTVTVPASVAASPRQYEAALTTMERPAAANAIYGVVRDPSGAVIPGASITAKDSSGQRQFFSRSDNQGYFAITNLPAGSFDVSIELAGFQSQVFRGIQVKPDGQIPLSATLQVATMSQSVEVNTSISLPLATSSASVGSSRGRRSFQTTTLPELQPPADAEISTAQATRVEDYFEYRFPFPIRLGGRQSALLPFLDKPIKAERVSIYKSGVDRDHPLNGAWVENNADVPLEPGPVTFFQGGRYAGETVIEYLSRGERRLVSYGVDYDVQAQTQRSSRPETISRTTSSKGVLTVHRDSVQTTSYKFRNKGQEAKTIILEHPRNPQRKLIALTPVETTAAFHRFRIVAQPGEEIDFPVEETVSAQTDVSIDGLHRDDALLIFSSIPANMRPRVEEVIRERERLAELEEQQEKIKESLESIFEDQERLRENLKVLSDNREDRSLRQRYLTQMEGQEDQVKDLRARAAEHTQRIAERETSISRLIAELTWD
jgi:hypothetical protein